MKLTQMSGTVMLVAALAMTATTAEGQFPRPIHAAIADLAERIGVAENEVMVAGFEEVTWPDASLGHPQPGEVYAQVQTPGYRVTLEARGERYVYHTDSGTRVIAVTAQYAPGVDREVPDLLTITALAKEHLAAAQGIDPEEVFLASIQEETWPDASLGRPQPGESYAQVETPGHVLLLEYEGGVEAYHADLTGRIVAPDGSTIVTAAAPAPAEHPAFVQEAINDLAGRHGLPPEAIDVVSVEERDWPDGARGLPEPGMMYTQAIVPGHRIVLAVGERRFAYHEGDGQVTHAGIVFDEDASVSLLTMRRAERPDGNNLYHLQRTDLQTRASEVAAEHISSFVATPDGKSALLKARRSRSEHALEVLEPDGSRIEVATAFDFTEMAMRSDGQVVAAWQRPEVGERTLALSIHWQPWHPDNVAQVELPEVTVEVGTPTRLTWTSAGLAASVVTRDGPRGFYLEPDGEITELGEYELLGWIPRTRSLLVTRATEDGSKQLGTLVPGQREPFQLVTATEALAATAPYDSRHIVAALGDGAGGVSIQRIDWGGSSMSMKEYSGVDEVSLSAAPVGQIIAVNVRRGNTRSTEVLQMPALSMLLVAEHAGPAQLVAD